jgi:hypothetical protein
LWQRRLHPNPRAARIPLVCETAAKGESMKLVDSRVIAAALALASLPAWASNHREAPITALDHKADITDLWAFVSYSADQRPNQAPEKVTFILSVDPLLEPANGPNWFPFDPAIRYEIRVDHDRDAKPDLRFRFHFQSEQRLPGLYTTLAGFESGARDPETHAVVVPPRIDDFDDPGLGQRQTYTVEMIRGDRVIPIRNADGSPFYAVPVNPGPRTMDYDALFAQGTYRDTSESGVSVWAGTSDDPFFIDLGGAFDTGNLRVLAGGTGVPGVLSAGQDAADENFAGDTVSGFAVNSIAIEVPIELLTSDGRVHPASDRDAVIGVWGTTERQRVLVRRNLPKEALESGGWRQIQRFGNPLINELVIGTGSKDTFSQSPPHKDSQFASFFLGMTIAQVIEALYNELLPGALDVPDVARTDLLPLVQYRPPIAPDASAPGPVADLMRLNTGVPATPLASASRLGAIAGDLGGFPNGRRLFDDVVDITLRVAVGGVLIPEFDRFPNNVLGDGVNVNDAPFRTEFPYLASSPSGRDRRHVDPGESFPGGGTVP